MTPLLDTYVLGGVLTLDFFWYFFSKECDQKNAIHVETLKFPIYGSLFPRVATFWAQKWDKRPKF